MFKGRIYFWTGLFRRNRHFSISPEILQQLVSDIYSIEETGFVLPMFACVSTTSIGALGLVEWVLLASPKSQPRCNGVSMPVRNTPRLIVNYTKLQSNSFYSCWHPWKLFTDQVKAISCMHYLLIALYLFWTTMTWMYLLISAILSQYNQTAITL